MNERVPRGRMDVFEDRPGKSDGRRSMIEAISRRDTLPTRSENDLVQWELDRVPGMDPFEVSHKLGRRPRAVEVVSGPVPLQVLATKAQRASWTTEKVVFRVVPYSLAAQVPVTFTSGSANVNVNIEDLELSFDAANVYVGYSVLANQPAVGSSYAFRGQLRYNTNPATVPPYDNLRTSVMDGSATTGGDLELLAHLYVRPVAGDTFTLRVY